MDHKNHAVERSHKTKGIIHFVFFFILIWAGIITKRVYGHPEYMMLFHGPAAVFLVLSGMNLTWNHRRKLAELKKRLS